MVSFVGRSDLTAVNEALDHPIERGPSALGALGSLKCLRGNDDEGLKAWLRRQNVRV